MLNVNATDAAENISKQPDTEIAPNIYSNDSSNHEVAAATEGVESEDFQGNKRDESLALSQGSNETDDIQTNDDGD